MTGTQASEVIALVEQLQSERNEMRNLLARIDAQVGSVLPADLRAELQRLI